MIQALHGFLGRPADWEMLARPHEAPDLLKGPGLSLEEWASQFTSRVTGRPWLIGYSMGGRLAMHAALTAPEKFSGVIFVSAHPGLQSEEERAARIVSDGIWAQRFRRDPWHEVVAAWNAQPVLHGESLERHEWDFDRERLAQCFESWSLGRQRDLRRDLTGLQIPHVFVTGSRDEKFTTLAKGLGRHEVIEGAGHRVPWERPEKFRALVGKILGS